MLPRSMSFAAAVSRSQNILWAFPHWLPSAISVLALALCAGTSWAQEIAWRDNYNAARKEAKDRGIPLVLDFGTDNCFWCKKLDETTFRDPTVATVLNEQFIPLRID